MKVLWLCNCPLSDSDEGGTGTWLGALARGLLHSDTVDLGIIAFGPVKQFTRRNYRHMPQWLVPANVSLDRNGLPPTALVQAMSEAIREFSPDLVHIWGTEGFWGLLSARGLVSYPSLLEIQGLKGQIAKVFFGGLTRPERLSCIGIKELLKRRTLQADRRSFVHWGLREEEIIRGHRFVDVQSLWVAAHIKAINPGARLFPVNLVLRQPFYDAEGWESPIHPTIFCTAASSIPYKGLHVAIRALCLLKKRIPNVRLRIAGLHQRPGFRQDGYMRWINRMIRQLHLADTIDWLGPLNAENICLELKRAGVVIIPTFIENCCTAMQEAMYIGTPLVVSYAGGIPSLGKDEESCLFFPPGDVAMCAYQLERVLTDNGLAERLSRAAREIAIERNKQETIINQQITVYRQVLATETALT